MESINGLPGSCCSGCVVVLVSDFATQRQRYPSEEEICCLRSDDRSAPDDLVTIGDVEQLAEQRLTAAARLARCAPAHTLGEVATAADTTAHELVRRLTDLPVRGRCARLAADTIQRSRAAAAAAEQSQACPPAVVRASAAGPNTMRGSGTAGWSSSALPSSSLRVCAPRLRAGDAAVAGIVAAANPDCPPLLLERLALTKEAFSYTRAAVAANPSCWSHTIERLASNTKERMNVRAAAVANPSCPRTVVERLVSDNEPKIRYAASDNPAMSPEHRHEMAHSPNRDVREAIAGSRLSPPDVLAVLAADNDPMVRSAVAGNPACSLDLLKRFVSDSDETVRGCAAGNPSYPRDALSGTEPVLIHQRRVS